MVFIGFLLVAAALAVTAGIVLDSTGTAELVVFGQSVPGLDSQWQVFLAGAGTALVLTAGLMITVMGVSRRLRDRRDLRDLREEHRESLTTLEMEKRRLEQELARVRQTSARPAPPRGPAATVPGGTASGPAPGAAPGVRVAPRSQVSAKSSFFERND